MLSFDLFASDALATSLLRHQVAGIDRLTPRESAKPPRRANERRTPRTLTRSHQPDFAKPVPPNRLHQTEPTEPNSPHRTHKQNRSRQANNSHTSSTIPKPVVGMYKLRSILRSVVRFLLLLLPLLLAARYANTHQLYIELNQDINQYNHTSPEFH